MPILGLALGPAIDPIVSRALRIGLSALLRSAIPFGNAFAFASLLASLRGKRSFLLQARPGPEIKLGATPERRSVHNLNNRIAIGVFDRGQSNAARGGEIIEARREGLVTRSAA